MANVGDNFTSLQSPEVNFTSDAGDGMVRASLDSLDPVSRNIFTKIQDRLEDLGIDLPELSLFDSGDSQNGQRGGQQGDSSGYDESGINCEPGADNEETNPPNEGNGNSNYEGLPYNKKQLAGEQLQRNKDDIDFNGNGELEKGEVIAYRDTLAKGSIERSAVNSVIRDFKAVKRLFNDERGEDSSLSSRDLERLVENNQQRGRLNGYRRG